MNEIKPAGWCLMTADEQIINGIHEERRHAENYKHRYASDTMTGLYTAEQLAEAVAAERERCAKVCEEGAPKGDYGILGNVGDALNRAAEAIRSAAK